MKARRLTVFENWVLRRIFGSKWDEVTVDWRKLHNEELYALYCSPHIIWAVKSRRMKWAGHVWETGKVRTGFWWGDLMERGPLEDLGIDGSIILKWIFKMWDWITLAKDRERWRTLLIVVMNLRVS